MERTTAKRSVGQDTQPAASIPAGVLEEREAIAREIHVGLAQSASAVLLGLDILRATALESAAVELERLERLATRNGREVRRLMAFLRAPRDGGLEAALQDYVDDVEADGSPITSTVDAGSADPATCDNAFRFIHRALAALERSGANGAITIAVVPIAEGALLVRVDSARAGTDHGRSLQGIAPEANGAPVVVRTEGEGLQLEAVIR